MHDDKKEKCECPNCQGKGKIHIMTEKEENNYWEDYL